MGVQRIKEEIDKKEKQIERETNKERKRENE